MNNATDRSVEVQERLGRKRFKSGIEFEKQILNIARFIQSRLLNNLPSNYPKDANTNLAELFLAIGEEFARLRTAISDVNEDRYHNKTRSEYLYEILGDVLFLDDRAINTLISDEAYRNYLITVRNAYYGGSRKDNIESAVSEILGLPVSIKELYLNLRSENSFYSIKDTHTMFFDIMMDYVTSTSAIGLLLESIKFFIDLIKPAHVLYDTRLIWTDSFTNREGKCVPQYVDLPLSEIVLNADRIYLVTYVITKLYQSDQDDPEETWVSGIVSSVDSTNSIVYLTNNVILTTNSDSLLYVRTYNPSGSHTDTEINISDLFAGQIVRYYSVKDSSDSSNVIEDDWRYEKVISSIDEISEVITLVTGEKIVYNSDCLIYTRDGNGEYRILISGLEPELNPNRTIIFRATKYTTSHDFYNIPSQVEDNSYKEFDSAVVERPYYQDNVKKVLETRDDLPEGPAIIVENGIAKVVLINGRFYKRSSREKYANFNIYRYNLYIEDEFKKQFSIEEPNEPITEEEAKVIFESVYGYSFTGSNADYRIDVDTTAHLKQATENVVVEGITGATEFCDRKAECLLLPEYEDVRKYWDYPDIQLTSGFVISAEVIKVVDPPGEHNIGAYFKISSDPNVPVPALLPMLNSVGDIASVDDIVVYVDGLLVEDAVSSLDPWTGDIVLNFLPPANTITRIDYYYADRYPKAVSYLENIGVELKTQRLSWPYPLTETGAFSLGGGPQDFQVDKFPIVDKYGNLADASDVSISVGEIGSTGSLVGIEQTETGDTLIVDGGITGIEPGDTIIIYADNYLDNTVVYEILGTTGSNKIVTDKEFGVDLPSSGFPYRTVHFTGAPFSVDDTRPLLGHVHLETGPQEGTYIKFDYYFQYRNRYFSLVPDVPGDTSPYMNMGYSSDTQYGSFAGYTLIPDMGVTGVNEPFFEYNQVAKKGYRYRAFDLANSSVLNSKDTLILNGHQRYEGEGSWKNNRNRLDDYNVVFSPEHLTDRNKNVILNDKYLENDLTPITQLYPGIPPFVKTFNDDGRYKLQEHPVSESTYLDPTKETLDLKAGFTIIGADESGLIDYQSACAFEENQRLSLYSSLKIVETDIEGYDGQLTSVTEGMRTIPIKSTYIDVYYPNREKRINDYLDYINEVPEDLRDGTVKTLKNSPIIKRVKGQWLNLKIGDVLHIKNVIYRVFNKTSGLWEDAYKNVYYTVIEIIDYETAKLSTSFKETTGEYDYDLLRDRTYAVDVLLAGGSPIFVYDQTGQGVTGAVGDLNRVLVLNGSLGFDYALPLAVYTAFSGIELSFSDPDRDPYPRSPDNPNITGLPTGNRSVLVTHETGLGPTDLGVIPLTSEIIGADGSSVSMTTMGYTGPSGLTGLIGFTGPSGAVDLGLTGPTDSANLRILDADDKYLIPSGETGTFLSWSESEYRVRWRNWDQELIMITFGSSTGPSAGVLEEEPIGLYDDLAEGIKRDYWKVSTSSLVSSYFFGTLIETSEEIDTAVDVSLYPEAFIVLSQDQAENISLSLDPLSDFPWLNSAITTYNLRRRVLREVLYDNTIKVTEIQELEPVL